MTMTTAARPGLRVAELAAATGVAADTIRYYERVGLLPQPGRTPAGYRLFSTEAVYRIRFIQGCQRLGLRLREIADLLAVRDTGVCPCEPAEQLLRRRLTDVDTELARLAVLRSEMAAMIAALPSTDCPPPAQDAGWCPPQEEVSSLIAAGRKPRAGASAGGSAQEEGTMNRKPHRVDLLENGVIKLTLADTDKGSLNGRDGYTGRATTARIHGPAGSVAEFYDNQGLLDTENHVKIITKVNGPVEVPLSSPFVGRSQAKGDGVYVGETNQYEYLFSRKRKLEEWESFIRNVPAGESVFRALKRFAEESDDPRVKAGTVFVKTVGTPPDDNYEVNNCSSVRFGE